MTNDGLGYSFNAAILEQMYKSNDILNSNIFMFNKDSEPLKMKSSGSKDSLKVVVENNAEESGQFESSKNEATPDGQFKLKPKTITVALHNPNEPANLRSNSFEIPLGKYFFVTHCRQKIHI